MNDEPQLLPIHRTDAGNGEERTAQIERIQARLERLRQHVTAEVAAVAGEMERLNDVEPPASTPPVTRPH